MKNLHTFVQKYYHKKEEEQRLKKLADLENKILNGGQRLGTTSTSRPRSSYQDKDEQNQVAFGNRTKKKPSMRPEYNPLMGDTTSRLRSCRPSPRGGG